MPSSGPAMSRRDVLALLPLVSLAPWGEAIGFRYECQRLSYTKISFTARGIVRDVYIAGDGPDVIVLHEITGATRAFFDFTDCLAAQGFRVHCPVLFGTPFDDPGIFRQALYRVAACGDFSEIDCWRPSSASPINEWLVALCLEVSGREGRRLGAIGMCLTGIQPLAMLRCRRVVAPVVCQPALPFGFGQARRALALPSSDIDLASARAHAEPLDVLAVRYSRDRISPLARIDRLGEIFGSRLIRCEPDGDRHSSLVHHPSPLAFDAVVRFLRDRLVA